MTPYVVVLAVIRTTHVRVNKGSNKLHIIIQWYINNACTNSADSAAIGESYHIRYIYLRARSQTQVQEVKIQDTCWHTSGLAEVEMMTAGPGPRAWKRGKGDVFRWNPEPGLNRSNLTILIYKCFLRELNYRWRTNKRKNVNHCKFSSHKRDKHE